MIRIQRDRDKDHLKLLVMFHYILAALNFVTGCSPMIHIGFGIAMLSGVFDNDPNPPPRELGWFFTCIGSSVMFVMWSLAFVSLFAGLWLARRSHYHLCFAIACVECIQVPQGTILGIFTILVLLRPTVKAAFLGEQESGIRSQRSGIRSVKATFLGNQESG